MFDSVHSSVRGPDDLVQDRECCLEGSELDERFDRFGIYFSGFYYLLATPSEAC